MHAPVAAKIIDEAAVSKEDSQPMVKDESPTVKEEQGIADGGKSQQTDAEDVGKPIEPIPK